jgi:hypothetical protein
MYRCKARELIAEAKKTGDPKDNTAAVKKVDREIAPISLAPLPPLDPKPASP